MGYFEAREKEMDKVLNRTSQFLSAWRWICENEPFCVQQFWEQGPYNSNYTMLACIEILEECGRIECICEEGMTQDFVYQTTRE